MTNELTSDTTSCNIIIAGGGLAGLSASIGLIKLGFHVDLIESRTEWVPQGSAFGLAANGRKALQELFQLPDSLSSPSLPPSSDCLDNLLEKGIYMGAYDCHLLVWWMMRDTLLEEVQKLSRSNPTSPSTSRITFHMGKTIESYDDTSDLSCVQATIKDVFDETDKTVIKGRLLIAADGVYSNIRNLIGLESSKFSRKTMWRGSIPEVPEGSILERFLEKGTVPLTADESTKHMTTGDCMVMLFNFHPKSPRKMTFVLNTNVTDIPSGTHPREIFQEYLPNSYHQQILEELYSLSNDNDMLFPLPLKVVELPKRDMNNLSQNGHDQMRGWGGRGRVTLIGDAAHAMRPASGYGGAMAFEDVVILCRTLKEAMSNDGSINEEATSTTLNAHNQEHNSAACSLIFETRDMTQKLIQNFESTRMDRVEIIWQDQWELSENAYKTKDGNIASLFERPPEFTKWVRAGV